MQKLLFLLLPVFLLFSCDFQNRGTVQFDRAAFDRERAAWNAADRKDYRFTETYFSNAGPGGPVRVTVTGGVMSAMEMLDEWTLANVPEKRWGLQRFDPTISDAFTRIENFYALAQADVQKGGSGRVDVTYNARYHYPEHIYYYSDSSPGDQDGNEGVTIDITGFEL